MTNNTGPHNAMRLHLSFFVVLTSVLVCTSCDPTKELDRYFSDQGLTRLRYVRDDLQPGGFIIVGETGRAVYLDNIHDYATATKDGLALPQTGGDRTAEYNAVLASYTSDRSVDASVAASFLSKLIPLNVENVLNMQGKVTIDMMEAKVQRMKIPDVIKYLGNAESAGFRSFASQQLSDKVRGYIAYEVFRTNKLKLTTTSSFDFKPSIKLTNGIAVVSEGHASFELKRTGKSQLEITGDRFYAFAIRTAALQKSPNNVVTIDVSKKFTPLTAMGAKEGVEYSRPLVGNFEPTKLLSRFEAATN